MILFSIKSVQQNTAFLQVRNAPSFYGQNVRFRELVRLVNNKKQWYGWKQFSFVFFIVI